jgi:hypothetical protein
MINEYEADTRLRIGSGNRNTRRKPTPVSFCPQIQRDVTWDRIGPQRRQTGGTQCLWLALRLIRRYVSLACAAEEALLK